MSPTRLLSLAAAFTFLLGGCSDSGQEDLRAWMAESAKGLRGNIKPLPEVSPYEPASYISHTEADPFDKARLRPEAVQGAAAPDTNRPREPLEDFSLENMQFVGFFKDKKRVVGQILVNGKSFDVRVGNYMGQNFGKVVAIDVTKDEEHLVLKELVQEADGAWVERESTLYLMGRGGQG